MPMMRHAYTQKEQAKVVAEIVKDAQPSDLAWIVRSLESEEQKAAWMKDVAGVPGPVISLIMLPAVRKYERTSTVPMKALIAGTTHMDMAQESCCVCM